MVWYLQAGDGEQSQLGNNRIPILDAQCSYFTYIGKYLDYVLVPRPDSDPPIPLVINHWPLKFLNKRQEMGKDPPHKYDVYLSKVLSFFIKEMIVKNPGF